MTYFCGSYFLNITYLLTTIYYPLTIIVITFSL